jgi:hypothetical protein
MNLFIFLPVVRRDVFLSDIQYGRLQLLALSTGHGDQSNTQKWETEDYTR